jgi:two-component system OmpR family sensor kinase
MNELLARLSAAREREQAFLGDAAHELRTPLTALRLQLDALLTATDEAQRRRAAEALGAGLDRAARLVEQLLTLSRQDSARAAQLQPVSLDALARDVIQELIPLADARRIDLGLAQSSPVEVNGDADALRALLRNLVDNAIRYTPESGRVDVAILEQANRPVLRVCDTGRGIAPEERERVFERFYRTAGTDGVGSGLGLAIVRKIAETHRAQVTIEGGAQTAGAAESSRGTCVNVRFAAAAEKSRRS